SAIEINRIIVSVEAHALYEKDLEKLESVGDPRVLRRIRFAETLTADEIEEAYTQRSEVVRTFGRMLEGFDALIAPTLAAQAPTIKEAEEAFDRINAVMLRNCSLINLADGCALTMPFVSTGGRTGALMAAAPGGKDARLLGV